MTSTIRFVSTWIFKARDAFAGLAEKPWTLFALLLAVNTLTMPYAGITHDARLYSIQVLNRVENGAYGDDLFFRYGSQDQYSLFSLLAAPVVHLLGLAPGFFVLYLVSKSLLIFGMIRIVQTLILNRASGVLTLIYCMAVTIHYGGLHVLNVQEMFLTSRLPAIGLTLVGLDLLLRNRVGLSLGILFAATAIHPLMAFGGLLIWAGCVLWKHLGARAFASALVGVSVLAAGVLAYEPLGKRFFGTMDDAWRATIRHASPFNFPAEWASVDWTRLAFEFSLGGAALWRYRRLDADKMRFTVVVLFVSLAALIGTCLAEHLPYAILLQGQPYRALWILGFLHLAFAFWLMLDWAQDAAALPRLAACGLLGYLCCSNGLQVEFLFPLCVFPLAVVILRGLERLPRDAAWLLHSVQASIVLGALGWVAYKYGLLLSRFSQLEVKQPESVDVVGVLLGHLGPTVCILLIGAALVRLGVERCTRPAVGRLLFGAAIGVQTCFFAVPLTDVYRNHCTQYRGDVVRMRAHVNEQRRPGQPLPTVYSNLGCLDFVWVDLHAKSYFDWWQAGGFMFRREMAAEGQRRACLVAPFELARFGKWESELTDGDKAVIARFFKTPFKTDAVSEADLARLCREPGLDYLLLEQRFDGLYSAHHGRLYLYPCQQVRNALSIPHPVTSSAVAANR